MNRLRHCLVPILLLALILGCGGGCTKRMRANRLIKKANSDFEAEKYDSAETEYKDSRRLSDMNPTVFGQLGRIYAKDGRFADAAGYLRRATELEPNNLDFQLALGQVYAAYHEYTNVVKTARLILSAQPTNEEALILLVGTPAPPGELRRGVESLPRIAENPGYHLVLGLLAMREKNFAEAGSQLQLALAANPKSSQAYFALADLHAVQRDEKEAARALQNAAAYAPIRSFIRIKYVDYLFQSGSIEEAWKVLREMTEKAPDYLPAWVSSMNLAIAQKKYDEAGQAAEAILSRDGRNYDGMLGRGMISLAKGDAAKALLQFQHMELFYKKSPQVKYQLALAYISTHDKVKWVQSLNEALALDPTYAQAALLLAQMDIRSGDSAAAVALLNRFIKRVPNVGQAHMLLADAYLAQNQPEAALSVYRSLAAANSKNPQVPFLMGIVLAGQHRNSEARTAFEKALAMAPDYQPAVEKLIDLDVFEHNYSGATAMAEAQITKNPKAAEPWEILAKIDLAQTNMTLAETALLKAIELNPDLPSPYLLLAQVYCTGTNYQPALLKLNALVGRTNDASAYLQIGAIHEQLKEFEPARDAYEKVLTINNHSLPALNNLAFLYAVRLNEVDRAYDLAQKARELRPYDPHVEDTLGWVLFEKGDFPRALTLLEDSAGRSPGDAEVQFHLGMTHYMMDEEESARVALQRAVIPQQDYVHKDEAKSALAVLDMDTSKAAPSVLAGLEKALQEHPNDPVILNRIGTLQEQGGAVEKAAATYEGALKKNPDAVHIMAKLARLYSSRLNQPDKALELANIAHKMAPDSAEVNGVLGRLVFRHGDYVWALSLLENSADRISNQPELLYDLAWGYYALGRIADAETTMQKALHTGVGFVESGDAKRFVELADAFYSPSKIQAASAQAQQILQADAKYVPALMVSGAASENAGSFKAAQLAYDKALEVYPLFMPAARQLAILDSRHFNDDARGCDWAEKAHSANPDDSDLSKGLAILSYYQTKYLRSADVLQETIAKSGNDGELYYYLGMDYYKLKRSAESKRALARALALKIPDNLAAGAKRTLGELK